MISSRWIKIITGSYFLVLVVLPINFSSVAQVRTEPELVDRFGKLRSNDDLLARIHNFHLILVKNNSTGVVVLNGTSWFKYLYQRKIEGCNRWLRFPADKFTFVFGTSGGDPVIKLWEIAPGAKSNKFVQTTPDYKLDDLIEPVEVHDSSSIDEYCPLYFDFDWYCRFLKANQQLKAKIVMSFRTKESFLAHLYENRNELHRRGIAAERIRFIRRKFDGESYEQYWLIPKGRQ